jgi:hypothetical protein
VGYFTLWVDTENNDFSYGNLIKSPSKLKNKHTMDTGSMTDIAKIYNYTPTFYTVMWI